MLGVSRRVSWHGVCRSGPGRGPPQFRRSALGQARAGEECVGVVKAAASRIGTGWRTPCARRGSPRRPISRQPSTCAIRSRSACSSSRTSFCPLVQSSPEARELFDLALVPGEPPKLWIDLISFVVMEPDHRTYRFLQDRQDRRDILFESADRELMAAAIRRHMAHRLVARERQIRCRAAGSPPPGYSSASLILAWVSGFAFGALALLGAGHLSRAS